MLCTPASTCFRSLRCCCCRYCYYVYVLSCLLQKTFWRICCVTFALNRHVFYDDCVSKQYIKVYEMKVSEPLNIKFLKQTIETQSFSRNHFESRTATVSATDTLLFIAIHKMMSNVFAQQHTNEQNCTRHMERNFASNLILVLNLELFNKTTTLVKLNASFLCLHILCNRYIMLSILVCLYIYKQIERYIVLFRQTRQLPNHFFFFHNNFRVFPFHFLLICFDISIHI